MTISATKLIEYLEDSGLGDRITNLKPGDSFGVEIPVDEENERFLRFWLTAEGSGENLEFVTLDFEGILTVRCCTDEKKLEDWLGSSGILELAAVAEELPAETEEETA